MAIAVFTVYKRIVVDKILIACIIRRIDIYYVNLALVSISESGESFEVVTFDKDMVGRIGRVAHDGTLRCSTVLNGINIFSFKFKFFSMLLIYLK